MSLILRCEPSARLRASSTRYGEPRRMPAPAPRPHPSRAASRPPQDEAKVPRSRDAPSHPSFATPLKGGGAPTGAPRVPPRRRKESLPAYAARTIVFSRNARNRNGGALAFRRPTAAMRRGTYLELGSGPRFLDHRIQTGGPSPAPVHLAVRSRAGRSMPKAARIEVTSPIREPRPPHRSAVTGRRPFDERAGGICNGNGDKCQGSVTPNATNSFGRWTPAIAAASDRAR